MKSFLNIPPLIAAWLVMAPTVTAAIRGSASYSIPLEVMDAGGRDASSAAYSSIGSLGGIAGTAAVSTTQAVFGIIGQIDTQSPLLTLPSPILAAATYVSGVPASFSITAMDDLDPNPVILATPASGSVFPLGDTTVLVSATDNAGNRSTGNFPVKVLSPVADFDNDGLSDAAEFNMAALGFDWQVAQTALVNTYYSNANGAGLYTAPQVQSLHSTTPLISRDPASGRFKLTMDWKKSTNLSSFVDFPAPPGSAVSITPQGDLEFDFPTTEDAAFFRIELE
jgi:HYR domain